jgi:hypothetical protein
MEEALIEVPTSSRFAGIELITGRIPDETTSLTFRHLDRSAQLGQEQRGQAGSRDAPEAEGQPVVFRDVAAGPRSDRSTSMWTRAQT